MCKLYFRHGTMNSSKTANLLMVAHNYRAQGKKVMLIKPAVDTRFGTSTITSRAVGDMEADLVVDANICEIHVPEETSCVLVDEAQFLSEHVVEMLRDLTKIVPVICYGLRTDYRSRLFPGSRRLLELADTIEEIKTVCVNCNRKAIINAKFYLREGERVISRDGSDEPDIGAEEKYQPMCWNCWNE